MISTDPLLRAEKLSRRFGYRPVLRDVSLELRRGQMLLLVGANGAGKTTLLRVLAGLLRPTSGTVECSVRIGAVTHDSMLYPALTARENLRFFARLLKVHDPDRIGALLELLGLGTRGDDRVQTFSRGMVQRLTIARALLHQPELLLLDEPLTGLDASGRQELVERLGALRTEGTAMVVVTHQPEALHKVGTHLGRLDGGRLLALEPLGGVDA